MDGSNCSMSLSLTEGSGARAMQSIKRSVTKALIRPAIVVGGTIIGCAFVDFSRLIWPTLIGAVVMVCAGAIAYVQARFFPPDVASLPLLQQRVQSEETAKCVQDL